MMQTRKTRFEAAARLLIGSCRVKSRFPLPATALIASFSLAACSPYVTSYHHVCFLEKDGLEVLQRSVDSLDPQGKPLLFAKVGLPIKARINRASYTIVIDAPPDIIPLVFLKVSALNDNRLHLDGDNLKTVAATSAMGPDSYTFDVERAAGRPLIFTVKDAAGKTLGSERLEYTVVSRGITYGVETI
jgi:hypothetical protein